MHWTIEAISAQAVVLARLQGEKGPEAALAFESPRRSKLRLGERDYHILDKDGFFRRDVRLIASSGTVEIAAAVGWSGRMWWMLPDHGKLYYDYTAEWNHHRVILRDNQEVMRLLPQRNGKKLAGCEVRGLVEEKLWSAFAFYLMIYEERESLETARQWSDLGKGAANLSVEAAFSALFDS